MKCTNCGKTVPDDAKVCGYCGHRLKGEIAPAPASQPPAPFEDFIKPRRIGTGWLIGAGIVIVLLAAAITFVLLRSKPAVLVEQPLVNPGSGQPIIMEPALDTTPENSVDTSKDTSNNNCTDWIELIGETFTDGTQMSPGEAFTKTWNLKNSGTCDWTTQYTLAFQYGDDFGNQGSIPLQKDVVPGQEIQVAINLTAPQNPGTYQGYWALKDASGKTFGWGESAENAFWVKINVVSNTSSRCALFTGLNMKLTYLDWTKGSALTFYLTIPGGVPGLEKQIPNDTDNWVYSAKIGDYIAENCYFQGYKEFLYCDFLLPESYSFTQRNLSVSVNGCDTPIFSQNPAYLPNFVAPEAPRSGPTCVKPADTFDFGAMSAYCTCLGKGMKSGIGGWFCFGSP